MNREHLAQLKADAEAAAAELESFLQEHGVRVGELTGALRVEYERLSEAEEDAYGSYAEYRAGTQ